VEVFHLDLMANFDFHVDENDLWLLSPLLFFQALLLESLMFLAKIFSLLLLEKIKVLNFIGNSYASSLIYVTD